MTEGLVPIGTILRGHLKFYKDEPWCKEMLLYSPNNQGDCPENRVMVYVLTEESTFEAPSNS